MNVRNYVSTQASRQDKAAALHREELHVAQRAAQWELPWPRPVAKRKVGAPSKASKYLDALYKLVGSMRALKTSSALCHHGGIQGCQTQDTGAVGADYRSSSDMPIESS